MRWNKYLPFAFLYFFVNVAGLPLGLTYTALLTPLFYVWILLVRRKEVLLPFLCLLLPFMLVHLFIVEVEMMKYAVAILNIISVYVFAQTVYTWLSASGEPGKVMKPLLIMNTVLCGVALICFYTPLQSFFWIRQDLTDQVDQFLRLKMFTYEASYYALLFTPVFAYYLLQYVLHRNAIRGAWLLLMIFLPMVLSFSIGVILCLLAAGLLTFFTHAGSLAPKRRIVNGFISIGFLSVILLAVVYLFFPDNPLFIRLENIFTGKDTSATGRTGDAFGLARQLLAENNSFWGIGPGQLASAGADLIRGYYLYHHTEAVAIPNAAAETLALFGWFGFVLRLGIQVFLFFFTRVWKNYYRLLLFFFMFLYQFMGSYITNLAEYVIWVFAFTHAFSLFDVRKSSATISPAEPGLSSLPARTG